MMPIEDMKVGPGQLLFKDEEGNIKELCAFECKEENSDDAVDAVTYALKTMTPGEISMSLEMSKSRVRHIQKMYGMETITRKRFKKLLMGCGMQRNDAEIIARAFQEEKIQYTPLGVQQVIETINMEAEKEEMQ